MQESYFGAVEKESVTQCLAAHAEVDAVAKFFAFAHLPPMLADVSFMFARQAAFILERVPRNAERTVGLRKLLESKDATVRAML